MHMPMQSASDPVLRRMNRKYTAAAVSREGANSCAVICRSGRSRPIIIVGFPGESDDDFERTLEYVRGGVFANAFTFMYSIRRGTPAAHWEQVPHDVATARFARLVDAQNAVDARLSRREDRHASCARSLRDRRRKTTGKLAAKALDNVTVIAPMPDDYDETLLRARAVARRRDRKRARMGLHGHDRSARGALRGRRAAPSSGPP